MRKEKILGILGLDHLTCSLFCTKRIPVLWMPFQILPDGQSTARLSFFLKNDKF